MAEHSPTPWVVDEFDDDNGFQTIRIADGSPNGDTESQPVATAYGDANAEHIVRCVNLHDELIDFVERWTTIIAGDNDGSPAEPWAVEMQQEALELLNKAKGVSIGGN